MKIFISTSSFGQLNDYNELFKKNELEVKTNPYGRKLKPEELLEFTKGCIGLIAGTELITENLLLKLPSLKVISRCGVGIDNIDLEAAKRLGIKVFVTQDAPVIAVAELTVGLMLNLLRKVNQMDMKIRSGKWDKMMGNLLYGKQVGIIGLGRIGRKVAKLLKPFNCKLTYSDPFVKDRLLGLKRLPLKELLGWADIVSIHASTQDKILNSKGLRNMKKGAWLINVSRGQIVDEKALYKVLKEGYLSGAALDVFTTEPYMKGKFTELDNVILTPHIGSYAKEARAEMERQAVENLLRGLGVLK